MNIAKYQGEVVINFATGEVMFPAIVSGAKVPGYFVDVSGNVWSAKTVSGFRKLSPNTSGPYPTVSLSCGETFSEYKENKRTVPVHRVVAETLIPFDPSVLGINEEEWNETPANVREYVRGSMVVNHIDHNKDNHHPSNLEWTTARGNAQAYQNFKKSA